MLKKYLEGYDVYTHNGKKARGIDPFKFIKNAQNLFAIFLINSIDKDGLMKGYDFDLIQKISTAADMCLLQY